MKKYSKLSAIILVVLMLAGLLAGCGAASKNEAADTAAPMEPGNGMQYTDSTEDFFVDEEFYETETQSTTTAGSSTGEDYSEKLIYTLYLSIETTDYDTSVKAIEELTAESGGYVEYAEIGDNRISYTNNRSAYYTLRIPASKLKEFENSCGNIGNVYNSSRETQNKTAAYIDLSARLSTYKTEEETLLGLLEQADSLETVIALNQRLSEVRYEIESIEASLRGIDALVAYSTVNIDLYEVTRTTAVETSNSFGDRVSARMSATLTRFKNEIEDIGVYLFGEFPLALLLFIINILPWAIVIAIVIFIIRRIRRRRKLRRGETVLTRRERKALKKQRQDTQENENEEKSE